MQSKHFIGLALIVGLAAGIIGWFAFSPKSATAPTTSGTATTTTTTLGGVGVQTSGQATVTEVDTPTAPKPPAMPALVVPADFSADVKQAIQIQWNTLTDELKKAPTRVDLWLQLGTTYKIAGQYDAAIAAWAYVAKYGPSSINYVAYGNLGDLYLNFIHDYAKAAAEYKAALSFQPGNPDYQAGYKAAQSHLQ